MTVWEGCHAHPASPAYWLGDGGWVCAGCKAGEPRDEPNDTDGPPPAPGRLCYFCSSPADVSIYHGIPSCKACAERASGRR